MTGQILSCPGVPSLENACMAFTARTPPPSIHDAMEFIVNEGIKEHQTLVSDGARFFFEESSGGLHAVTRPMAVGCLCPPHADNVEGSSTAPYEGDGSGSDVGVNSDGEYEYEDEDMLADDWDCGQGVSGVNAGAGAPPASLPAPSLTRNRSHVTLTMQDVRDWIASLTRQVVTREDIHPTDAQALLRFANWDADLVAARLNDADRRETFITGAGAAMDRPAHRPPFPREEAADGTLLCNVCFEPIEAEADAHALECGHWHCKPCWTEALVVAVTTRGAGGALGAACLEPGCGLIVDDATFQSLLPESKRALYDQLVFDSFVGSNPSVVHCPRPQCGRLVAHSVRKRTVSCKCGHVFCFTCGQNPHAPVPCSLRDVWKGKAKKSEQGDEAKLSEEERGNYKFCPNPACKAITYRDGGCMYLTCSKCQEPWCWKCGQWGAGVHHVFECNAAVNEEWAGWSDGRLFSDEGRFDFYYNRYREHKKSLKFAAEQLQRAEQQEAALVRERHSLGEITFVKDVVKLIMRCRRALAWTNVYAFFIKSPLERERFQCTESQLEELTVRCVTDRAVRVLVPLQRIRC